MAFRPTKPARYGSVHQALREAVNQVGGRDNAAAILHRSPDWIYSACDPNRDPHKAASLSYEQARTLSMMGAQALAEDLARLAGGMFMPPPPRTAPIAIQSALAAFAKESGEAIAEVVQRAADGVFDTADADAALREIDDVLKPLMALRALVVEVKDSGEALR